MHGDICERNVCIRGDHGDASSVMSIDFGEVTPRYRDDVDACGHLLLWCIRNFEWSSADRHKIETVATKLTKDGDLEAALTQITEII